MSLPAEEHGDAAAKDVESSPLLLCYQKTPLSNPSAAAAAARNG